MRFTLLLAALAAPIGSYVLPDPSTFPTPTETVTAATHTVVEDSSKIWENHRPEFSKFWDYHHPDSSKTWDYHRPDPSKTWDYHHPEFSKSIVRDMVALTNASERDWGNT
ncbi:hypothetical protein E8E13_009968 [Curvularia kusanoi]|uniref:Uncharacterized protein n=1 Tax=Curvularia kusanoi TaxID=90978 RepID=A0A9P4WDC8_CURKU|nr:hypothetical protein E8E13_009968 [Curvularia kusanoi]